VSTGDRRKDERLTVSVPVRVQGHSPDGAPWEEMTTCEDTSRGGARFPVRRPLTPGQVLFLSLPLPRKLRKYALADTSYRVYALVRSVRREASGTRVGVKFLGQKPPPGYEQKPGALYFLPTDARPEPAERRRDPRVDVFLTLRIKRQDGAGGPAEEKTVTENVSAGGARVPTTLAVSKGEVVTIEEASGAFRARAQIRNVFIGRDGTPRLNLTFLDKPSPELLRALGLTGKS
jgi:PilZ domain-containing protein